MEEGKVTHPDRGSPQGGVISPLLSNIFLHEVDRQWCRSDGIATGAVGWFVMRTIWCCWRERNHRRRRRGTDYRANLPSFDLAVNQEKSRLTTLARRICVSGLRVSESSWPDAVDVAAQEGVPQYPADGCVKWCDRFRVMVPSRR